MRPQPGGMPNASKEVTTFNPRRVRGRSGGESTFKIKIFDRFITHDYGDVHDHPRLWGIEGMSRLASDDMLACVYLIIISLSSIS